ncbi:hypothetical protein FOL47_010867 [Perkinsus chesapeaki]|uniref:Uncharacterized protein n=1 Tax=Perkinsus chesapeaki TaxID=330153 RepID=A0A7J6MNI9_PERCH|nr:hypothetical protein FOL47_010867 [Perkinsus chesapeaki]
MASSSEYSFSDVSSLPSYYYPIATGRTADIPIEMEGGSAVITSEPQRCPLLLRESIIRASLTTDTPSQREDIFLRRSLCRESKRMALLAALRMGKGMVRGVLMRRGSTRIGEDVARRGPLPPTVHPADKRRVSVLYDLGRLMWMAEVELELTVERELSIMATSLLGTTGLNHYHRHQVERDLTGVDIRGRAESDAFDGFNVEAAKERRFGGDHLADSTSSMLAEIAEMKRELRREVRVVAKRLESVERNVQMGSGMGWMTGGKELCCEEEVRAMDLGRILQKQEERVLRLVGHMVEQLLLSKSQDARMIRESAEVKSRAIELSPLKVGLDEASEGIQRGDVTGLEKALRSMRERIRATQEISGACSIEGPKCEGMPSSIKSMTNLASPSSQSISDGSGVKVGSAVPVAEGVSGGVRDDDEGGSLDADITELVGHWRD